MSLLTVGQTLWDVQESALRLMIEKNIASFSKKIITQYSPSTKISGEIKETTVSQMVEEVKRSYIHKIDMEMDGFLESFPKDSRVLAVNVKSWGWIYYIQNRDGHWNLVYDKEHPLCREYAIMDFTNWVKQYGKELADIMAECIMEADADVSPFAQTPNVTCSLGSVTRENDSITATIELEET
jgi:hypothetical protein